MKCRYCGKVYEKSRGLSNHECRCKSNPERKVTRPSPTALEKIIRLRSLYRHTREQKEKISEARSRQIEEKGGGGFLDVAWYKIQNISGETYNVRGTWEFKYAQYLNSRKILWNRNAIFKYEKKDGIRKTYIPDFYLPESNEYHEVKGYFSESDKEKIALVEQRNGVHITLLFKKDLESLGIQL
jgi:hypothetical protein